jgi:hypothetical protein
MPFFGNNNIFQYKYIISIICFVMCWKYIFERMLCLYWNVCRESTIFCLSYIFNVLIIYNILYLSLKLINVKLNIKLLILLNTIFKSKLT